MLNSKDRIKYLQSLIINYRITGWICSFLTGILFSQQKNVSETTFYLTLSLLLAIVVLVAILQAKFIIEIDNLRHKFEDLKLPTPEDLEKEYNISRQKRIDSDTFDIKNALVNFYKEHDPQEDSFTYTLPYKGTYHKHVYKLRDIQFIANTIGSIGWFVEIKETKKGDSAKLTISSFPREKDESDLLQM